MPTNSQRPAPNPAGRLETIAKRHLPGAWCDCDANSGSVDPLSTIPLCDAGYLLDLARRQHALLAELEWPIEIRNGPGCKVCWSPESWGHAADCQLAALLAEVQP